MKTLFFLICAIIFSLCISAQTDGSLDINFGNSGAVITEIGTGFSWTGDMEIQNDGKIVIAGHSLGDGYPMITLVRYNENGIPDINFGINGFVFTEVGIFCRANAMAIQSDGKIIVAGYSKTNETTFDWVTLRYNYNGSLDETFGNEGVVITNVENSSNLYGVEINSEGKILVCGYSSNGESTGISSVMYNTDGSLDLSYGDNGFSIIKLCQSPDIEAWAVDMIDNGQFFAAGFVYNTTLLRNKISIVKFLADGNIDNSFGINGVSETSLGDSDDFANAIYCLPDKNILIAGSTTHGAFLARFDKFGNPDNSFGINGFIMTNFGTDENENYGLTVQRDGKIVVAGVSGPNAQNTNGNFGLVRYNSDGSIDENFGSDGKVTLDLSNGYNDVAFIVKEQPDGKLVASGISQNGSYYNISLARFHSENTGINQIAEDKFLSVYPNPTKDYFTIIYPKNLDFSLQKIKIEIINNQAQIVKSFCGNENSISISLQNEIPGTYIIKLSNGDDIYLSKIILK